MSHFPSNSNRQRRRFTLIELLVVISIIAILAAMLLPALATARERSKRIVCLAQLDQSGKALYGYFSDNERLFPPKNGSSDFEWIGKDGSNAYFSTGNNDIANRHLNPYMQTSLSDGDEVPIAHCPSDDGAGSSSVYDDTGASYVANIGENNNGALNNCTKQSNHHKPNRLSLVESPSRFAPMFPVGFRDVVKGNAIPVEKRLYHTKVGDFRWNVMFTDGHVAFTEAIMGDWVTDDYSIQIGQ